MKRKLMLILCGILVLSSLPVSATTVDKETSISANNVMEKEEIADEVVETEIDVETAGEYTAFGTIGEKNGITWKYSKDTCTLELSGMDELRGETRFNVEEDYSEAIKSPLKEINDQYLIEKVVLNNVTITNYCLELFHDMKSIKELVVIGNIPDGCSLHFPTLDFSQAKLKDWIDIYPDVKKLILPSTSDAYEINCEEFMYDEAGNYYYKLSEKDNGKTFFSTCPAGVEILSGTLGTNNKLSWSIDKSTNTLTVSGEDTYDYANQKFGESVSPFAGIASRSKIEKIQFKNCKMKSLGIMGDKPSNDLCSLFRDLTDLKEVDLSGLECCDYVASVKDLFSGCSSLEKITFGQTFNEVERIDGMFSGCEKLTSMDMNFIIDQTVSASYLFSGCSSLTSVNLRNNTYKGLSSFFSGCSSLKEIDQSQATLVAWSLSEMFKDCSSLESIDLSQIDTHELYRMEAMFSGCTKLKTVDLSNFDLSGIEDENAYEGDNYKKVFAGCTSLTSIKTPRVMGKTTIALPVSFYDANKTEYKIIGVNDGNKTLETIAAHEHNYTNGKCIKETSCYEDGVEELTCSICGDVIKKTYPKNEMLHQQVNTITPATLASDGHNVSLCKVCGKVLKDDIVYRPVKFEFEEIEYDGKTHKPEISIALSHAGLGLHDMHYSVEYPNAVNVGTYKAVVKANGEYYKFTKTVTFKILPPSTSFKKTKREKQKLTLKWEKKTKMVDGYEVQCSTSSKFTKSATKTKKVKKNKTTSVTFSNIKSGKKYYARIRTYKKVSGKTYYSEWDMTQIKK